MLRVEGLTKSFSARSRPALAGIGMEVRDGEILGLVGLNGAGKTTTIRIAAGVTLPSSGDVLVDGHDIVRAKQAASQRVGWVPEGFPFEMNARASSLLTYYAGFNGLRGSAAQSRCKDLLLRVGLEEVQNDRLRTFSQGMKKRFAIAAAMIADPPNILLDEILNGLDPEGMAFARGWMLEERKAGRAILLSSHLLSELQTVADRIVFLHKGRVLKTIDRAELSGAETTILRISIENLDAAALTYLATVGKPHAEGSVVYLEEPSISAASLNGELVKRGYHVAELRAESASLEAYFLRLIGSAG